MAHNISVGSLVVVRLADPKTGEFTLTSAAEVKRVEPNDIFVQLTGLVPEPYAAGFYLPVNPDKIERMIGWYEPAEYMARKG